MHTHNSNALILTYSYTKRSELSIGEQIDLRVSIQA